MSPTTDSEPTERTHPRLRAVRQGLATARRRCIGYPAATDIDFAPVAWAHHGLINNVGEPGSAGRWPVHTKELEREVVAAFVQMFGGGVAASWGYVTGNGSSEGVLHSMWLGRERFPDAWVYHSAAAHYSVGKAARLLDVAGVTVVDVDPGGELLYEELGRAAAAHRDRAALVVLTAGTTVTEAVDDIGSVHEVLTEVGIDRRHVVVDAALSGPALAADGGTIAHLLGEHGGRSRADADAVIISGHKSYGTPIVCGVVVTRRTHVARVRRAIDYIDDADVTVGGSRSGQAPVQLWHAMTTIDQGLGLRRRAQHARELAQHTVDRLTALGWPAWRHPHAWTVVLAEPSPALSQRWALATSDDVAHIVCAPGRGRPIVDEFLAELTASTDIPQEHTA